MSQNLGFSAQTREEALIWFLSALGYIFQGKIGPVVKIVGFLGYGMTETSEVVRKT